MIEIVGNHLQVQDFIALQEMSRIYEKNSIFISCK